MGVFVVEVNNHFFKRLLSRDRRHYQCDSIFNKACAHRNLDWRRSKTAFCVSFDFFSSTKYSSTSWTLLEACNQQRVSFHRLSNDTKSIRPITNRFPCDVFAIESLTFIFADAITGKRGISMLRLSILIAFVFLILRSFHQRYLVFCRLQPDVLMGFPYNWERG